MPNAFPTITPEFIGALAADGSIPGATGQIQVFLLGVTIGDGTVADNGLGVLAGASGKSFVNLGRVGNPAHGRIEFDNATDILNFFVKTSVNPFSVTDTGATVHGSVVLAVIGGATERGRFGLLDPSGVYIAKTAGGVYTPGNGRVIMDTGKLTLEGTAIWLAGELRTQDNDIVFTDNLDRDIGAIGRVDSGAFAGSMFLAKLQDGGIYDPDNDGAIVLANSGVAVFGPTTLVESLSNPDDANKQVYANADGILYTVDPPAPGWEVTDTDITDYDLGTGTGTGAWVEMTGLEVTVPEDVAAGDRVDVAANVEVVNKTGNRAGSIDIGFGINNVAPASGQNFAIPAGFSGYVVVSISTTTHGGLTAGDTIDMFARRFSGEHNSFGVDLLGSTQPHEMTVSVPSEGGATVDAVTVNRTDHGVGDLKAAVVSALPGTPDANTLYFVTG